MKKFNVFLRQLNNIKILKLKLGHLAQIPLFYIFFY